MAKNNQNIFEVYSMNTEEQAQFEACCGNMLQKRF